MPDFQYTARDQAGTEEKGKLQASNQGAALAELRRRNLMVLSIAPAKARFSLGDSLKGMGTPRARLKADDLAVYTRQLSTMLSAGIPLLECLEILAETTVDRGFRLVLEDIVARVRGGEDFSRALSIHSRIFSRIFVSMIQAGETSGQLDIILTRLAEYMEASAALRREIKSAMTYPVVSLVLVIGVFIFLMIEIVPKFEKVFKSLRVELPVPTKLLLSMSRFMVDHFPIILIALAALVVGFILYKRTDAGQRQWHGFILRMPIFGPLFQKVALSRFSRTFATLIRSGVPILEALEIVGATSGNRIVEEAILDARDAVRRGDPLGERLVEHKVIPIMVSRMISIGERSGALEQLLEKISEFYDQQVRATVETLTSMIEPILIVIMGVLVGAIVISIFLPMLKVQEALRTRK